MDDELRPYAAGTDFHEGFEVRVTGSVEDGTRRAIMLPKRAKRLKPEHLEAYIELQHAGARIAKDQALVDELVPLLREGDTAWSLIGFAVGITGETARQRWGDPA